MLEDEGKFVLGDANTADDIRWSSTLWHPTLRHPTLWGLIPVVIGVIFVSLGVGFVA
jgi:hypothetical protein